MQRGNQECQNAPHVASHVSLMNAVKTYRLMLGLSIISNLAVGVIIFGWPDAFTSFAGQPEAFPKAWPRHWGMQLCAIDFLYFPGWWNPEENRWPN